MLQEYRRKRNFAVTPEPAGAKDSESGTRKRATSKALKFVIQKHSASHLHYDFRLEIDGVMVSWAVPKGPSTNTNDKRLAMMTEDHPMEYASFEGIIPPKQYGAGEVIIWDQGIYSPDDDKIYSWSNKTDANKRMRAGLKSGKLSFYLKGDKLEGSWTLVRMHGKEKEWLLIKHHDQFEDALRDVTSEDTSVVTGRTLLDLQKNGADLVWTRTGAKKVKPAVVFPKDIAPMLATLADAPFKKDGWFFEPKLDGVRAIAYIKNGACTLSSRNQNDLTKKYPAIAKALSDYKDDLILDGEVVALDTSGKPSFQHLQQSGSSLRSFKGRRTEKAEAFLYYYVFDILYAQGQDLTQLALKDRKEILGKMLQTNDAIHLVTSLGTDGFAAYHACVENKLEGVVGKKEDSKYEKGARSKAWLKVKTNVSGEFLVCGFTEGTGSRKHTFGSLLLGEYDEKNILQYVGGVGTGFDEKKLNALIKRMKPLITKTCPFKQKPTGKLNPTWVKPEIVVEIKYLERTQDDILRAPVYLHVREDIEPKSVQERPFAKNKSQKQKPKKIF